MKIDYEIYARVKKTMVKWKKKYGYYQISSLLITFSNFDREKVFFWKIFKYQNFAYYELLLKKLTHGSLEI